MAQKSFPPKKAETRAIVAALSKARARGFHRIHILSNSFEVVRAIKGPFNWFIEHIEQDNKALALHFEFVYFSCISIILDSLPIT